MLRKSAIQKIKQFDVYPKTAENITVQTPIGATVTIIGSLLLLFLAISEFGEYYTPNRTHSLKVNYNRDEKMKIGFRILFSELPCEVVNIDITDRFGGDEVAVETKSFIKLPWKGNFTKVKGEVDSENRNNLKGQDYEALLWTSLTGVYSNRPDAGRTGCMPCHEASGRGAIKCCNNCLALKRAYAQSGLDVNRALTQYQCAGEAEIEGCMIHGYIEVNKVQGNFHIAVGESHVEGDQRHHHHWPAPERKLGFNTTHYISMLAFGEQFPNMENPLDGFNFVETGIGQQQYFIQVVPTSFQSNGHTIETNQYSVTYHHSVVDLTSDHLELPGVFFKYDISEVKIFIQEETKSFSRFITRLCAVIGGVWVVIGLIYNGLKGLVSSITKID